MYIDKEHREYRALNSPWTDHIIAHTELQIVFFKGCHPSGMDLKFINDLERHFHTYK